jgi:hypothetical protein
VRLADFIEMICSVTTFHIRRIFFQMGQLFAQYYRKPIGMKGTVVGFSISYDIIKKWWANSCKK